MPLLAMATTGVAADARGATLMTWVDQELAPYVATQLTRHPRFKGETVVFVALDEGTPAPVTDSLTLELRDRLVDALVDVPGVTIGWRSGHGAAGRNGAFADCTRDAVHYYFGLQLTRLIDGRHRVTLRALDAADRSWVTGTGKTWQGRLTRAEKQAYKRPVTDEYFRGSREVPYSTSRARVGIPASFSLSVKSGRSWAYGTQYLTIWLMTPSTL